MVVAESAYDLSDGLEHSTVLCRENAIPLTGHVGRWLHHSENVHRTAAAVLLRQGSPYRPFPKFPHRGIGFARDQNDVSEVGIVIGGAIVAFGAGQNRNSLKPALGL
jgi:hypothetical protein